MPAGQNMQAHLMLQPVAMTEQVPDVSRCGSTRNDRNLLHLQARRQQQQQHQQTMLALIAR